MNIDELKQKWEMQIVTLTEQMNYLPTSLTEYLLIKEERETLIRCLDELNKIEK